MNVFIYIKWKSLNFWINLKKRLEITSHPYMIHHMPHYIFRRCYFSNPLLDIHSSRLIIQQYQKVSNVFQFRNVTKLMCMLLQTFKLFFLISKLWTMLQTFSYVIILLLLILITRTYYHVEVHISDIVYAYHTSLLLCI